VRRAGALHDSGAVRPFPSPDGRPSDVDAMARLVDELELGVAHLDPRGAVVRANAAATAMLEGRSGADLSAALVCLASRAGAALAPVTEALLPSSMGEVRVLLTREGDGFLAALQRDASRRLRDQVLALRGMLAAAVSSARPEATLQRALAALASVCAGSRLALWGAGREGALEPLAQAQGPGAEQAARPLDGEDRRLAERAMALGMPVHQPLRAWPDADGLAPRPAGGALAIPVRDADRVVGALCACGPRLGEGEMRLLGGLADAAGALLGRAQDQAAREAAEAVAERARAVAMEREGLAMLGHLAACVTHEVASPLACLGTNLRSARSAVDELLRADGPSRGIDHRPLAQIEELLADAGEEVGRVASLVRALRGLARRRADDHVPFHPLGAVEDAVRIFRGARHAEVSLEAAASVPEVLGSPALLCQAVLNLLDNGLDAMDGRGPLSVRLGPDGDGVVLEVEDRGRGVPEAVQPSIWEAYFTTKPPGRGTGLGLYICRDVAERMGGTIGFDTGADGTTFRLRLPAAASLRSSTGR